MSKLINVLHLSDLHYTHKDNFSYEVVLDALKADLNEFCDGPHAPDLIVFSGDLVHTADEDEIYWRLCDDFFRDLQSLTKCNDSRFVICPGNHDAHQGVTKSHIKTQYDMEERFSDRDHLNNTWIEGGLTEFVQDKFEAFEDIRKLFAHSSDLDDGLVSVYHFNNLALDVVCLNTAWMTGAGLREWGRDETRLIVPEAAIYRAIKQCTPSHKKLLVTHHPLDCLSEENQKTILNAIDGHFDMHFFGHKHDARPGLVSQIKGKCLLNQSGALHMGRDYYNGYSLVTIDTERDAAVVQMRQYFDRRHAFGPSVEVSDDGLFKAGEFGSELWKTLSRRVNRDAVISWLSNQLQPVATANYNEGLIPRKVSDIFVPPPMYVRDTVIEEVDGEEIPKREERLITIQDIISDASNIIINGGKEYGNTTLLQQIALGLISNAVDSGGHLTVPLLINFPDIRPGSKPVIRAINSSLLTDFDGLSLEAMLEEGLVTLLVDDVDFRSQKSYSLLRDFITKHPRNRFVLMTKSANDAISEDVVIDTKTLT